ncbi:hypothetical protein [Clostridium akagii]|uniref:hypothetical protein n=1 Tax=Clostridium akagii TaxID=91623 RepID=UPI00047BF0CD|nr:hypothetical protein [Clostridium akagii]
MEKKEIIVAKIADIIGKQGFIKKNNGELKARLKCAGLNEYYEKYSKYLIPYCYRTAHGNKYENSNEEYNVFLGLDFIFSDLYMECKNEAIILLLKELTKAFNISYIEEEMVDDYDELVKLYQLLGLDIYIENDNIKVLSLMHSDIVRITEVFSVESWLMGEHPGVYDSYDSAISAYTCGHAGACIESCRTALVSIFSEYKGTESFAKWLRGIFNVSGDVNVSSVSELDLAIKTSLRKDDLAKFFNENKDGKLTKTKTIYMIYSMMSDYGTHRNESTYGSAKESPTIEDAIFMLRLTDSILFWVFSMTNR